MEDIHKGEVDSLAHREARLYAITSVGLCTLLFTTSLIAVPILCTSMHGLHSEVSEETDFCKIRVRDIWQQMYAIERRGGVAVMRVPRDTGRSKRDWLFGQWINQRSHDAPATGYDTPQNSYGGAAAGNPYGVSAPASNGYDAPPPSRDAYSAPAASPDAYGQQAAPANSYAEPEHSAQCGCEQKATKRCETSATSRMWLPPGTSWSAR
jgi:hypothetical protein